MKDKKLAHDEEGELDKPHRQPTDEQLPEEESKEKPRDQKHIKETTADEV